MADKKTVLVSPDSKREWTPESPTQETNLLAQGWKVKAEEAKPTASKSTDK